MPPVRRLTAILAADVAGYSRLMGADEEGTHERLKAHVGELVNPKIREHRGRTVKNTGDGLLAEFASVVDAVRCAVEIQGGMAEREPEVPEEQRIRFRIGINLGDVIVEEHDIFGDGVNVAARLEALADAGGVFVSNTVCEHVRDRLPFAFEDLGEQQFKNIARPVRVYALRTEPVTDPRVSSPPVARPAAQPAGPPRLSIVVLPFANLSNDPEQGCFADGITEDLTTDLSRIANILVISRNTAFTYRNKQVNTKKISRELGVRYLLEGSVRRSGSRFRVNAQLIDAENDAHLWAERFDHLTGDLLALQDEITSRIAVSLNLELTGAEAARPTVQPDALDYLLRGRAAYWKPPTRDNFVQAISLFERALSFDERSIEVQSWLASALVARVLERLTDTAAQDVERAEGLIERVLAASPHSPLAHWAKGQALRAQNRSEQAIPEFETVIASDRNWVLAFAALGWCKFLTGSIEEAIPLQEQAIRLSPRDPYIGGWYARIGIVHLVQLRTEEAISWFKRALGANPGHPRLHVLLASAYGLQGESEQAAMELTRARRLNGNNLSNIARLKTVFDLGVPKVRALLEATVFAGLRKAGMPEE